MDKVDEKILVALIRDSRQSVTQIARQAKVSRDVVRYRIAQLQKSGVIRDFITDIDHERLGYISALFFVSINADAEQEFTDYINSLDFVSWAGTHLGFWTMGMAIYGKDTHEVEARFQAIFSRYKEQITDHRFAFYKTTRFFTEKYFGKEPAHRPANKVEEHSVDDHDKAILRRLAKDSRMSSVELARHIPLTPVAIAHRIKKLERSGFIRGYSIYINVFRLELFLFIFFIQNRKLDQRKQLFDHLKTHPKVSLLLDYVGDPFIEFGVFVKNPYDARQILQEIKQTFPDNRLVDFFMVQEDFISFGAPPCVFR